MNQTVQRELIDMLNLILIKYKDSICISLRSRDQLVSLSVALIGHMLLMVSLIRCGQADCIRMDTDEDLDLILLQSHFLDDWSSIALAWTAD